MARLGCCYVYKLHRPTLITPSVSRLIIGETEPVQTTKTLAIPTIHRNVAGYVRVRFSPGVLRVGAGDTATGHVQVDVQQPHQFVSETDSDWNLERDSGAQSTPALHACLVDRSVAMASWSDETADSRSKSCSTDLPACSTLRSSVTSVCRQSPQSVYRVTVRGRNERNIRGNRHSKHNGSNSRIDIGRLSLRSGVCFFASSAFTALLCVDCS